MNIKKQLISERSSYNDTIYEEQQDFVKSVLEDIGLNVSECFPENVTNEFTVEHKINLRKVLNKSNISIIDDGTGGLCIFVKNIKIAEWIKPSVKLKQDEERGEIFAVIDVEYWTSSQNSSQK